MEKEYVICRTCGYIMKAEDLKEVCPACGVKAKVFEPYKSKVDPKRSKLLEMHMHPIILHFPQALVVFALLLLMLLPFLQGDWKEYAEICARFNTFLLPFSVIGGFLTGLIDGKLRYKSVKTPALVQKMILGIVFFVLSAIAALVLLLVPLTLGSNLVLVVILLAATLVAVVLGRIGATLVVPIFPGK